MKKKTMKKVLTLLIIIAPAFVGAYSRYCASHPVPTEVKAKEKHLRKTTRKTVSTSTVSEVTEEVCLVE